MKFFTSDSHIGHARILELGKGRPFRNLAHMHSILLANAWKVMTPDDELWHLGDAAMGNFDDTIKILASYPGKKFLVPGNHDKVFPKLNTASRIERFKPLYEAAGFQVMDIHHLITLDADGGEPVEVRLSHVPYSPERYEGRSDKLAFARPENDGKWLIHGHTHSTEKRSDNIREIHVGVDANDWTPVSELDILKQIRMAA